MLNLLYLGTFRVKVQFIRGALHQRTNRVYIERFYLGCFAKIDATDKVANIRGRKLYKHCFCY